jgi:hypothetical protein
MTDDVSVIHEDIGGQHEIGKCRIIEQDLLEPALVPVIIRDRQGAEAGFRRIDRRLVPVSGASLTKQQSSEADAGP